MQCRFQPHKLKKFDLVTDILPRAAVCRGVLLYLLCKLLEILPEFPARLLRSCETAGRCGEKLSKSGGKGLAFLERKWYTVLWIFEIDKEGIQPRNSRTVRLDSFLCLCPLFVLDGGSPSV